MMMVLAELWEMQNCFYLLSGLALLACFSSPLYFLKTFESIVVSCIESIENKLYDGFYQTGIVKK